jgi:hypothetical protein
MAALNLADIYAYFDQEEKCKEWLQKAQESDRPRTYDNVLELNYLLKYSNKPWFKELKWKEYK